MSKQWYVLQIENHRAIIKNKGELHQITEGFPHGIAKYETPVREHFIKLYPVYKQC